MALSRYPIRSYEEELKILFSPVPLPLLSFVAYFSCFVPFYLVNKNTDDKIKNFETFVLV